MRPYTLILVLTLIAVVVAVAACAAIPLDVAESLWSGGPTCLRACG